MKFIFIALFYAAGLVQAMPWAPPAKAKLACSPKACSCRHIKGLVCCCAMPKAEQPAGPAFAECGHGQEEAAAVGSRPHLAPEAGLEFEGSVAEGSVAGAEHYVGHVAEPPTKVPL